MTKLFYSKKLNQYFYRGIETCFICGDRIEKLLIVKRGFSKILSYERFYCVKCQSEAKKPSRLNVEELTICTVEELLPVDCVPIFFKAPGLQPSKSISSFEAAALPCEKTIEKTRYSKESIEGVAIGKDLQSLELEHKEEKVLDVDNFLKLEQEAKHLDLQKKKLIPNDPLKAIGLNPGAAS